MSYGEVAMCRLWILTILVVFSVPDIAVGLEFKREAVSGKTTKMWNYGSWDRKCETKGGVVKLLTKPSHGTATPRRTVAVAKFNRFDPSDHCLGKSVSMFQVLYTSARGFHGTDTFQIERTLWYGQRDIDTFTVEVR
jgi:hypothetical protein